MTTSIRISPELRRRLDRAARKDKTTRNRLIGQALDEYLRRRDREALDAKIREEARLIGEHDRTSKDTAEVMDLIEAATADWMKHEPW